MTPEPFVTADEVAEHVKITRRQVLEMARKNLIPAHPIFSASRRKIWRFKLSEVDQAIASGTRRFASAVPQIQKLDTMNTGSPCSRKEQSNG